MGKQTTHKVTLGEEWAGSKVNDVQNDLREVIREVLKTSRGDAKDSDLVNLILHNNGLSKDIAITLRPWGELNEDVALEEITRVLQSNQDVPIDPGFQITVGSIEIPSGKGYTKGYTLSGADSSVRLKNRAFYEVCNDDVACLYLSVAAAWIASLQVLTAPEWQQICRLKNVENHTLLQQLMKTNSILKQQKYNLLQKGSVEKLKPLTIELCELAGLDYETEGSFHSLPQMEVILGSDILVLEASLGNKVVRAGNGYEKSLFIYSVSQMINDQKQTHYHAIKNIQAVFNRGSFCEACQAPHGQNKKCPFKCFFCKTKECPTRPAIYQLCTDCNIEFPNDECFVAHLKPSAKGSNCERYFTCQTCQVTTSRRNKDGSPHQCYTSRCTYCQKMVTPDHLCYNRSADPEDTEKFKYIFFDFEARQDAQYSCDHGYSPLNHKLDCSTCSGFSSLCLPCRRCANCNDSQCGASLHVVNYVNIQTACHCCWDDPTPISEARCTHCGDKCEDCKKKKENQPLCDSCGHREIIFSGENTVDKFCQWMFTKDHQGCRVFSHNGKGYDNHFVLRYLLTQEQNPFVVYQG